MRTLAPIICFLCLTAAPAAAGGFRPYDLERWLASATAIHIERPGRLDANSGLGLAIAPEYRGAKDLTVALLPLVDVEWRGKVFLSTQRGVGYNWISQSNLKLGPRLTLDVGRGSAVSSRLSGQPNVNPGPELGLFIDYFAGSWRLRGDLRHGVISGHEGFLVNLDLSFGGRLSERSSLIIGADLHWVGSNYADAYFSVRRATARAAPFAADSGFRDIGFHASLIYDLTKAVYVSIDGLASTLLGDAADSPISERSAQFFVGTVVGLRF